MAKTRSFLIICLLMTSAWANAYGQVILQYSGPQGNESPPQKYKNDPLTLKLVLLGFAGTLNQQHIEKTLQKVNQVYSQCGIVLEDRIDVVVLDESSSASPRTYGAQTLGLDLQNRRWAKWQKEYMHLGIPVFFLDHGVTGGGWPVYDSLGEAQKIHHVSFNPEDHPEDFPPFAVYLSNANFPRVAAENTYRTDADKQTILAHELGHLLFDEGHSGPGNLMCETKRGKKNARANCTKITETQCEKARSFIRENRAKWN